MKPNRRPFACALLGVASSDHLDEDKNADAKTF